MFTKPEQQFLLSIARKTIERHLMGGDVFVPDLRTVPPTLCDVRASFVTLTKDFELRGCMGTVEPYQPLYVDVIKNALAAAFDDDRFFPVTTAELADIAIEVSVLTLPTVVSFSSPDDLLSKLTVGVDGVIVEKDGHSATYLPQVWDEILDKHDFMSSLCLKAGLAPDAWLQPGVLVETYQVEIMRE